jgi:hemolysin D
MQTDRLAMQALLARYGEILREAWKVRHQFDAPSRNTLEAQFLPAHLEIIDTPVHPWRLWTMRAICALVVAVAAISIFGHLDIVVTAHGKIVPNARVKIIQPAVTGVVRDIKVRNGMQVLAGQVLLELDPAQAAADTDRTNAARVDAQLDISRANALLRAQVENRLSTMERVPEAPPERQAQTQAYAAGAFSEYRDKLASLQSQLQQRQAQLQTTRDDIEKLKKIAPLARQQARDYETLAASKYVATHAYLDKEQNALQAEGDLRTQTDHAEELSAAIHEQEQEIAAGIATFRREQLADLAKAQLALAQSTDDHTKAMARERLMKLTAPVGGTVQNLAVHTVGGVVTTAQSLLEIVPRDTLEVEASVENKDVGFVESGQDVTIKIEAFPYTRFGYMHGKVIAVANDAVRDQRNGLQYAVRVRLPADHLLAGRKKLTLTPGMQVEADIRTGRRTVADYFLSPITETFGKSLIER